FLRPLGFDEADRLDVDLVAIEQRRYPLFGREPGLRHLFGHENLDHRLSGALADPDACHIGEGEQLGLVAGLRLGDRDLFHRPPFCGCWTGRASFGGARDRWRRLPRAMTGGEVGPNSCFAGAKRRSNVLELPSELRTLPSLLSAACFPVKAIHNINSSQRATLSAHTLAGGALRRADSTARPPVRRPWRKCDKDRALHTVERLFLSVGWSASAYMGSVPTGLRPAALAQASSPTPSRQCREARSLRIRP